MSGELVMQVRYLMLVDVKEGGAARACRTVGLQKTALTFRGGRGSPVVHVRVVVSIPWDDLRALWVYGSIKMQYTSCRAIGTAVGPESIAVINPEFIENAASYFSSAMYKQQKPRHCRRYRGDICTHRTSIMG